MIWYLIEYGLNYYFTFNFFCFKEYLVEEQEQSEEHLMQLSEQAETMRVLINTTNYDYGQIKAKMDLTYPHRQRLVREMKPIKDIIELYPAFSIVSLVCHII